MDLESVMGFCGSSPGEVYTCNAGDPSSIPESERSPGEGKATHSSFPGDSDSKESTCNARYLGSIPGLRRSPGEGTAIHSSILAWRIPMYRGAWQATAHGVAKSQT